MDHEAFRDAILTWGEAAIAKLQQSEDSIQVDQRPFWIADGNDNIELRLVHLSWNFRHVPDLLESLPEWRSVKSAFADDVPLQTRFGRTLGTFLGGRTWQLEEWARSLIPLPAFDSMGTKIKPPELSALRERLGKRLQLLLASEVTVDTVWPIIGLECKLDTFDLDPGVTLRRLTPTECAWAFQYGVLRTSSAVSFIARENQQFYGLVLAESLPFGPLDDIGTTAPKAAELHFAKQGELEERLHVALALIGESRVFTPGRLQSSHDFEGYGFYFQNVAVTPMSDHVFMKTHLVILDSGKLNQLKEAWRMLGAMRATNPSLYLSALRLSYANARAQAEDRILDVVIAAEALYLSTDMQGVQQELSYRASLRAAFWSNDIAELPDKQSVFDIVKAAYALRSKVARGESATPIRVQGQNKTPQELTTEVASVVRLGLLKAFRQANTSDDKKFKPHWEQLIIG